MINLDSYKERAITLDNASNIVFSGSVFCQALGLEHHDVKGKNLTELVDIEEDINVENTPHFEEFLIEIQGEYYRFMKMPNEDVATSLFLILNADSSIALNLRHLAHELRNPLTNISLSSEFIKSSACGEEIAEFSEIIERNIIKLTNVLDTFTAKYKK